MHRQASIPHESPADRMGKKHEVRLAWWRKQLAAPQVSVPTLGWEAGVRVGRQMGGSEDGGGEIPGRESVCACVCRHVCVAGVCLPVHTGEYNCVSTKSHCMCANTYVCV